MNSRHDTDGLSKLSDEIEEAAKMIGFLKDSFFSHKLHAYNVREELRNIHHVPSGFAFLIVERWCRERERNDQ